MLGFSPLASTPLGDDGFVESGGVSLSATSIVTGSPVVASSAITQDHSAAPVSLTTGSPTVSAISVTQEHTLTSNGPIVSGSPTRSVLPSVVQDHALTSNSIVTGSPLVASSVKITAPVLTTGSPTVTTSVTQELLMASSQVPLLLLLVLLPKITTLML
jgi:hypothetical protein